MAIPENNHPKLSIVTVCYNAASEIERTIKSVINQTYSNVEYIIIDGGSKDGTVDIIKKYADKITYWVSEPDKGIYDAMNKGIIAATGDWINFMNAGDWFCDSKVLDKVVQEMKTNPNVGVFYGNVYIVKEHYHYLEQASKMAYLKKHMPFCHQAVFTNILYHKAHLFDTTYKICADYNFFYKAHFKDHMEMKYIPVDIAYYDCRKGLSKDLTDQMLCETMCVQKKSLVEIAINCVYHKGKRWLKQILLSEKRQNARDYKMLKKGGGTPLQNETLRNL